MQTVGISNLFSQLNHLNPKFLFPSDHLIQRGEIASDYGFDKKSVTLRLIGRGKSLEYTFGNLSRDETKRYLQIKLDSSSSIWQCPKQIYDLLNQSFIEWAEPTFFNIPLYTIDAFFFSEYKNGEVASETHVGKKLSKWQISLPFQSYADEEEVLHLLHSFSSESIVGFVDSSLDEMNTTKVLESCFQTSNEIVRFTFHKVEDVNLPHLLVNSTLTNQNFWVRSDFIESVRNLPSKLREKRLFGMDSTNVERIKITDGNQSITLRHQEKDDWIGLEDNASSSNSFIADAQPIKQLIHNLNLVSVTNFTIFDPTPQELAKQGFNSPKYKLEIDLKNSTSKKVLISKSNSESSLWNTYIVNQALVCLVNTQWDKLLSTKLSDFQSRELLPANFFTEQINFKNLETNETIFKFSEDQDSFSFSNIENLRAESFIDSKYNEEGVWINGDWLPWKYSLSFQGNGEKDFPEIIFLNRAARSDEMVFRI